MHRHVHGGATANERMRYLEGLETTRHDVILARTNSQHPVLADIVALREPNIVKGPACIRVAELHCSDAAAWHGIPFVVHDTPAYRSARSKRQTNVLLLLVGCEWDGNQGPVFHPRCRRRVLIALRSNRVLARGQLPEGKMPGRVRHGVQTKAAHQHHGRFLNRFASTRIDYGPFDEGFTGLRLATRSLRIYRNLSRQTQTHNRNKQPGGP